MQSIQRIENIRLWELYAVLRKTVMDRAAAEGVPKERAASYEQLGLYHGTNCEVVEKIVHHGFNRSFCGKNATVYGAWWWGVPVSLPSFFLIAACPTWTTSLLRRVYYYYYYYYVLMHEQERAYTSPARAPTRPIPRTPHRTGTETST